MNNNLGKQTKVLTNKFGLFARGLDCLSEFWFVCQNFGLFARILVYFNSGKQTKILTNKPKCQQTTRFDKTKI
jgi:hypothetical protein